MQKDIAMMAENDERIVSSVQHGRTEAFAVLVDRHKDKVYGTIMRLTGDPQAAEELAQETFVRAFRSLRTFRGKARFSTWLVQIAINLVRDHVRERRRSREISLDALLERDEGTSILTEMSASYDPLEELGERDLMERFDVITARAVANIPQLFDWSIPFLKRGGFLLLWKGCSDVPELKKFSEDFRLDYEIFSVPDLFKPISSKFEALRFFKIKSR